MLVVAANANVATLVEVSQTGDNHGVHERGGLLFVVEVDGHDVDDLARRCSHKLRTLGAAVEHRKCA